LKKNKNICMTSGSQWLGWKRKCCTEWKSKSSRNAMWIRKVPGITTPPDVQKSLLYTFTARS